jgi:hypothetical protein
VQIIDNQTILRKWCKMKLIRNPQYIDKVLSLFSFALILISLYIIIRDPGAKGYEISIYYNYPNYFWYLLITAIFIGQLVLILNAFFKEGSAFSWIAAIIGISMAYSILLLLPLIRGYAISGGGDAESHIGYMLDILRTGQIGPDMYPILHILGVTTLLIAGIGLNISTLLYPTIFYVIYVLFIFLTYKIVLDHRSQILIGMTIAPLLLLGYGNAAFAPNSQANALIPLIFYIFFTCSSRTNIVPFELLLVIFSIFIVFFHPLVCLIVAAFFCIVDLSRNILNYINSGSGFRIKNPSNLIGIILITFFMWQSYAYILLNSLSEIYQWLQGKMGESLVQQNMNAIEIIQPSINFLIKIFIFGYGVIFLITILSLLSILIFINAWIKKRMVFNLYNINFSIAFVFFSAFNLASFFLITGIGLGRMQPYIILSSLFLIPLASCVISENQRSQEKTKIILLILFAIFLLVLVYLSIFTVYPSPLTRLSGTHVPFAQLEGMNTFFKTRSDELQIIEWGLSTKRMYDALYGISEYKKEKNIIFYTYYSTPDHLGYTVNTRFGDYYNESKYFVLNTVGRIIYPEMYPGSEKNWRINQSDFLRLEKDISVIKFYDNKEMEVYLIHPFR